MLGRLAFPACWKHSFGDHFWLVEVWEWDQIALLRCESAKLRAGIVRACTLRPVSPGHLREPACKQTAPCLKLLDCQTSKNLSQVVRLLFFYFLGRKLQETHTHGLLLSCSSLLVIEGLCLFCELPGSTMWDFWGVLWDALSVAWTCGQSRPWATRNWVIVLVLWFLNPSPCLVVNTSGFCCGQHMAPLFLLIWQQWCLNSENTQWN